MDSEYDTRLARVEEQNKSNTHRLDRLEAQQDDIHRIALSVERMGAAQEMIGATVSKLDTKVDAIDGRLDDIERKPAKRWDGLVDKVLLALAGAFVAWLVGG